MSEEIHNAAIVVPRSVIFSIFLNRALGLAILLMALFSLIDFEKALKTLTHYPFIQIFLDSTRSVAGAATMTSIVTFMGLWCNVGILATASRQSWSFCRDRGLPGWQYLQYVSSFPIDWLMIIDVCKVASCQANAALWPRSILEAHFPSGLYSLQC